MRSSCRSIAGPELEAVGGIKTHEVEYPINVGQIAGIDTATWYCWRGCSGIAYIQRRSTSEKQIVANCGHKSDVSRWHHVCVAGARITIDV